MNKKKSILIIITLLSINITFAQKVGINTNTPQATLDVNGVIQVRKEIRLGGQAGTTGNPGSTGQAFVSQGTGKSPIWSPVGLDVSLGFGITQSVVLTDSVGVLYTKEISSLTAEYLENSELSTAAGWTELEKLRSEIKPTKANNRVVVTLQTIAQTANSTFLADAEVAIGIFVDGKLKSVRHIHVGGSSMTFTVGTLFDSFENLPVKENNESYTIQVAFANRYNKLQSKTNSTGTPSAKDYYIMVGKSTSDVSNTSNRMNMTSLKLELYEEIL